MLPTEDPFVYVYVLVDDGLRSGAIAIPCRGVTGSRRRCRTGPEASYVG